MNKFLLLLRNELYQSRDKYWIILAAIFGIYFSRIPIFNGEVSLTTSRVYVLVAMAVVIAPFYLYGFLHQDKKSFFYAMQPASLIKKYSLILVQCFVTIPVFVFAVSNLFEYCLSVLGWANYIHKPFENYIVTYIHSSGTINAMYSEFTMFIAQVVGVTIITSISILAVNLFRYKKLIKTLVFFYIIPSMALLSLTLLLSGIISADFTTYLGEKLQYIRTYMEIIQNYTNIIGVVIVIAINYITWRVFKNKQLQ